MLTSCVEPGQFWLDAGSAYRARHRWTERIVLIEDMLAWRSKPLHPENDTHECVGDGVEVDVGRERAAWDGDGNRRGPEVEVGAPASEGIPQVVGRDGGHRIFGR